MRIVIVSLYFLIRVVTVVLDIKRYSKYDSLFIFFFWIVFFSQYCIFSAVLVIIDTIISIKHCLSDEADKYIKITSVSTLAEITFVWIPSIYSVISSWNSSPEVLFINLRII